MPPKLKTGPAKKTEQSNCDVCCAVIVEGKEEALQCEGSCQMWMHRYCAGVTLSHRSYRRLYDLWLSHFKHLTNSAEPFVCTFCSHQVHRATVCQLQSEISALKAEVAELRSAIRATPSNDGTSDAIAALASEVQQLKVAVADAPTLCLQEETPSYASIAAKSKATQPGNAGPLAMSVPPAGGDTDEDEWQEVVAKGKKKQALRKGRTKADQASTKPVHRKPQWLSVNDLTPTQQTSDQNESQPLSAGRKNVETEEVEGVRRIWGTAAVRGCTSRTILTVLQKFSTVAKDVEVRRKFKKCKNNRVQWWFLVRGDEEILQVLQGEWEHIYTQTSWKLERCHKPVESGEHSPGTGNVSSFLA